MGRRDVRRGVSGKHRMGSRLYPVASHTMKAQKSDRYARGVVMTGTQKVHWRVLSARFNKDKMSSNKVWGIALELLVAVCNLIFSG